MNKKFQILFIIILTVFVISSCGPAPVPEQPPVPAPEAPIYKISIEKDAENIVSAYKIESANEEPTYAPAPEPLDIVAIATPPFINTNLISYPSYSEEDWINFDELEEIIEKTIIEYYSLCLNNGWSQGLGSTLTNSKIITRIDIGEKDIASKISRLLYDANVLGADIPSTSFLNSLHNDVCLVGYYDGIFSSKNFVSEASLPLYVLLLRFAFNPLDITLDGFEMKNGVDIFGTKIPEEWRGISFALIPIMGSFEADDIQDTRNTYANIKKIADEANAAAEQLEAGHKVIMLSKKIGAESIPQIVVDFTEATAVNAPRNIKNFGFGPNSEILLSNMANDLIEKAKIDGKKIVFDLGTADQLVEIPAQSLVISIDPLFGKMSFSKKNFRRFLKGAGEKGISADIITSPVPISTFDNLRITSLSQVEIRSIGPARSLLGLFLNPDEIAKLPSVAQRTYMRINGDALMDTLHTGFAPRNFVNHVWDILRRNGEFDLELDTILRGIKQISDEGLENIASGNNIINNYMRKNNGETRKIVIAVTKEGQQVAKMDEVIDFNLKSPDTSTWNLNTATLNNLDPALKELILAIYVKNNKAFRGVDNGGRRFIFQNTDSYNSAKGLILDPANNWENLRTYFEPNLPTGTYNLDIHKFEGKPVTKFDFRSIKQGDTTIEVIIESLTAGSGIIETVPKI